MVHTIRILVSPKRLFICQRFVCNNGCRYSASYSERNFSGTVKNTKGETLNITDGKIVNGALKHGIIIGVYDRSRVVSGEYEILLS